MTRIFRHGAVLLAFALAAGPVVVPVGARADSDPCDGDSPCIVVTVDALGQSPTTVTIGASSFGPGFGGYTLYGKQAFATAEKEGKPPVGAPSGLYPSSLTAAQVVAMAGVTLTSTTIMTIPRFDGSVSALDEQDLEGTSYGDAGSPRFGINGTQLQYVRPQLANHPQDANGYDLDSVDGGELDVTIDEQGKTLNPVVQPPSNVQPGKPAQFHVVGIPPDPDYSYAWQFGGGSGGGGPAPEHTYGCGYYGVQVDVSDASAGVYGTSDVVLVDVCPESTTPSGTGPGHGTGSSSNPPTGPDKGSGHGGGPPTTAPHSQATGGRHTAPRNDPVATPTANPPSTAEPTGSDTQQGPAGPTSAAVGGQQTSTTSASSSGAPGGGPLLHGVVINAAQVPLSQRAAHRAAARADSPQASRRPGTTPFDATILWWLLIPVLLALGATTERRRPRRRATRR